MLERAEFDAFLLAAKSGDVHALSRLVQEYEPELRAIARRRLGKELRPFLDSVDLVQSVHRSLLLGLRDDRFDISTQENLLKLASTIVQRKIAKHWRRLQRQKHGHAFGNSIAELLLTLQSGEIDSSEQAQLKEAIDRTLRELDSVERTLIEMRLQGASTIQVANHLQIDSDVLRVKLSRLRKRLRESGLLDEWL